MFLKKSILFLIIFTLLSQLTFSQWTRDKGKGYYKISGWYLQSDQHYTDTGDIDPNATRSYFNLSFYGLYGISKKVNLIGYIPFFSRTVQNDIVSGTTGETLMPGEAVNAIGDIDIGIIYSLLNKNNWALSATLKLGLPTGEDEGGNNGSFQTGDGEFNQLLQLNLGRSLTIFKNSAYAKAYVGFNNRSNGFSDELKLGAELGIKFFNKLFIIPRSKVNLSLNNGSLNAQNAQGNIFANNVEYVNMGVGGLYYITKKFGVSLGFDSAVSGRIIAANPSFSAGLFLDIK